MWRRECESRSAHPGEQDEQHGEQVSQHREEAHGYQSVMDAHAACRQALQAELASAVCVPPMHSALALWHVSVARSSRGGPGGARIFARIYFARNYLIQHF